MHAPQSAVHQLLLGREAGQMNLAAVRDRVQDLRRSLDHIGQGLRFAADRVQW